MNRLRDYANAIPKFDDWASQTCFGFFAYGNGRALPLQMEAQRIGGKPEPGACAFCPRAGDCWDALRKKAAGLMPVMVNEFEEMSKSLRGVTLLKAWGMRHGHADPYMLVMMANMQTGLQHEVGHDGVAILANIFGHEPDDE